MARIIALFLTAAMCLPMTGCSLAAQAGDVGHYTRTKQAEFYGCWYAMPYLSADARSVSDAGTGSGGVLYDARYLLDVDGTFLYGCDESDGLNRARYTAGNWYVEGGKLYLEIWERLVWEGGEEVPASGSIRTERMIENPTIRLIGFEEAELEVHDITGPLSPLELGGLETAGRKVIKLDGQAFYGFGSHENLLNGFWKMKELAEPVIKEAGVPLFEYLADPALVAFAMNFETDFPISVSVRHDGEAGGIPVTATDPETIRAVFEALRQMTVLGEWPASGHTDDYLNYYFEMANGSEIYGFAFQDGMLLDGGLGVYEISGFEALQRALPDPWLREFPAQSAK